MNHTEASELKNIFTDSIRYWERGRIAYNSILLVIVFIQFVLNSRSLSFLTFESIIQLFFCWVIANILYCSAYVVDVFVQYSQFREIWKKYRILLLVIGIMFASTISWYFAGGIFRK